MKIRPVGSELFLVDRRTDMTKLTVVFRNFANAPKNTSHLHQSDTDVNYTPLNLRDPLHNKKSKSE
jgi:hypothetical protein